MDEKYIKPIPKKILKRIKELDEKVNKSPSSIRRFYSYLDKFKGKLVRVFVAVKNRYKDWYCKQVIIQTVHQKDCLVKDIIFGNLCGHVIDWYDLGLQTKPKWFAGEWGLADKKYFTPFAPIINKDYVYKFEQYKYSLADQYTYNDLFKYLRIYEEYPQVEYLMKLGLSDLATSKTIIKKMLKDSMFRKWIVSNIEEIRNKGIYVSTLLYAYKNKTPIKETQKIELLAKSFCHDDNYQRVKRIFSENMHEFYKYILTQNTSTYSYCDYLKACEYLNLDMRLPKNRAPHEFEKWHQIRVDEYHTAKAKDDAEKAKELILKFEKVASKYFPLEKTDKCDFLSVIAKKPAELVTEGEKLHHCVGKMGYDQKFAREESLIFFIRNTNKPSTPFVTIEYSLLKKKILQCYGKNNTRPSEQVLNFINKTWLPYANKQLKKIAI